MEKINDFFVKLISRIKMNDFFREIDFFCKVDFIEKNNDFFREIDFTEISRKNPKYTIKHI